MDDGLDPLRQALVALQARFAALDGGDDAARHAFVEQVRTLSAEPALQDQASVLGALHWMAAEALKQLQAFDEAALDALLAQVAAGEASAAADAGASAALLEQLRLQRAAGYLRLNDALPAARLGAAIDAAEAVLATPEAGPLVRAPLAFSSAQWRLARDGLPRDDASAAALQALLTEAHARYREAGRALQAHDAALLLAQVVALRLESGTPPDAEASFDTAWRALQGMLAERDPMAHALAWARGHVVAARLVRVQPGTPPEVHAPQAQQLLDRALPAFERAGAAAEAGDCARDLALGMDRAGPPWDERQLRRFELYLDVWAAAPPTAGFERYAQATRQLMRANGIMKSLDAAEVSARAGLRQRLLASARESALLAEDLGEHAMAANAWKLLGSALLRSDDGGDRPLDGAAANEAFDRALAHARTADDAHLEAQLLRQRAVALTQRLQHGEGSLADTLLPAWNEALAASVDDDAVIAAANLVGACLLLQRAGHRLDPAPAHAALARAQQALAGGASFRSADHLARAAGQLATAEALGTDGLAQALAAWREGAAPPPAIAAWAWRSPLFAGTVLLWREPVADQPAWQLAHDGTSLHAQGPLDCEACGQTVVLRLPLVGPRLDAAALTAAAACPACGAARALQWACLMAPPAAGGLAVAALPDVLSTMGDELRPHQVLTLARLARGLLDVAPESLPLVGWSALPSLTGLHSIEDAAYARLQAALQSLLHGLARADAPAVLAGLQALQGVAPDDLPWDDALDALPGASPAQRAELCRVARVLMEQAAREGAVAVADQLQAALAARPQAMHDFSDALALAADPARRRAYLERLVAELPDHSPERAHAFTEQFLLHEELQLRDARARGDADVQVRAALLDQARAEVARMIDADRQQHSSARARALIGEHLSAGRAFVLVLRAFALDDGSRLMSQASRSALHASDDPRVLWRVTQYDSAPHAVDAVCRHLPPGLPALAVANVRDLRPPEAPALVFVTDLEWQRLAFTLAAEAHAIVLLLPRGGGDGTDGVAREIRALAALGRQADTVCVRLDRKNLTGLAFVDQLPADAVDQGVQQLQDLGFTRVVEQEALDDGALEMGAKSLADHAPAADVGPRHGRR